MRFMITIGLILCACCGAAFGQDTQPGADNGDAFVDAVALLGSPAAIIGLTLLLVQWIKNGATGISFFNKVPIWVYTVVIASALTWLSKVVFGALEGEVLQLVVASALNALATAGTYSVATTLKATPQMTYGADSHGHDVLKMRQ